MKRAFRLFVYLSLAFVVIYLVREDLVALPRVRSYPALLASLAFLLGGFLATAVAWSRILSQSGYANRLEECIAAMGLAAFGKYVPGKVWALVARAAYVADRRGFPLAQVSTVSLRETFLSIWTGLVLGAGALVAAHPLREYGGIVAVSWALFSVLVFSERLHEGVERFARWALGRPVSIPRLGLRSTFRVIPWCLIYWGLWSVGFQRLATALSDVEIALHAGLAFPLAGVLGNLAVFVPGGLGVREAVLAGYLVAIGVPTAEAATLSLVARLWFLVGESCFFVAGLWAGHRAVRPVRGA